MAALLVASIVYDAETSSALGIPIAPEFVLCDTLSARGHLKMCNHSCRPVDPKFRRETASCLLWMERDSAASLERCAQRFAPGDVAQLAAAPMLATRVTFVKFHKV